MNKLVLAVVGLVILLAGVYYFMTKDKGGSENGMSNTENGLVTSDDASDMANSNESSDSGQGSFSSLLALGKSVKCTYNGTLPSGTMSGTFYTDGNQHFRMETTNTTEQGTLALNTINDSEYTYSWGEGPTGAMAIKVANNKTPAASPTGQTETPPASPEGIDLSSNISYDCSAWSADPSFFTPPADVDFMDMEALQKSVPSSPSGPDQFPWMVPRNWNAS